jgi:hypothetical protein
MMPASQGPIRPPLRVIATPVPRLRLIFDLSRHLRDVYADLLAEPLPERLSELVRRIEPDRRMRES